MDSLRSGKGFTLVEILIVVAIIALLGGIAIPNFLRARQIALQNTCIANLKQIQGAVQIFSLDASSASNYTPSMDELVPNYIRAWPKCGTAAYEIPTVDGTPVCPQNISGHSL